jgi:hypothetical protein
VKSRLSCRWGGLPICLILLNVSIAIASDQQPDVSAADGTGPSELQRLWSGEILLENIRTDESGGAARVRALSHGPVEAVWAVIASCEDAYRFVRGMRTCEVLEDSGERALVHQAVKQSWIVPRIDFTFETLRQPYTAMDFHMVEGDLRTMEGLWRFESVAESGAFIMTHEIRVQPRFPVPRWLVRRSIGRDVPGMLACIRGLASGSGSEKQRQQDLAKCHHED